MSEPEPPQSSSPLLATDAEAASPGLPAIGKWMIDHSGTVAHWLGAHLEGKRLYEPINVILIDEGAVAGPSAGFHERVSRASVARSRRVTRIDARDGAGPDPEVAMRILRTTFAAALLA